MARTTVWKPKRIRSEEERRSGSSQFLSIDEGENFVGYALFEADPSVDDPAYYEFAMHWVGTPGQKGAGSVPCADDNCPLCEDGDRPKTRAYSLWLVTQDANKNKLDPPQLGIWEMNYNVIKMFTEWRAEGDKIKGRLFRVGKLDDRGNYNITPKTETMSATAIKAALKDPNAPDFDAMITSKLRKAMEGMAVARAVEDDDDEDEAPAKGRKPAGKPAAEKPAAKTRAKAWPDDLEDEEVTVSEVDDDGNYFVAAANGFKGTKQVFTTDDIEFELTTLEEDDVVTITAALDDDGDYILSAEPELAESETEEEPDEDEDEAEDEDAEESDLPESVEDVEFIVKKVNAGESTIDVENDDLAFELFFLDQGPASEVDFDDYEEGVTIIVSAEKDSQGDMVATEVPKVKKTTTRRKPSTSGRKTTTTRKGK
jgi:hypothetical protein